MSSKSTSKKLSRRDAIKLLGAVTGATVLANLPSKWKTPQIARGVLPAHAQSSTITHTLSCGVGQSVAEPNNSQYASQVTITPNTSNIVMRWTLTLNNVSLVNGANPTTDTELTNGSGIASISTPAVTITNPALSASVTVTWSFENASNGSGTCNQVFSYTAVLPIVNTVSITDLGGSALMNFAGEVTSEGSTPVTARGFVWGTSANPSLPTNNVSSGSGIGSFTSNNIATIGGSTIHLRAYATNSVGTVYGNNLSAFNVICLAEGMLVTLANGSTKKIEDIDYEDKLLIWDFDEGKFDEALPLWIKKAEIVNEYNLIEFSNGSFIKTVHDHRIFNKEKGMFTYPMISEDAPIGTTTFNSNGEEVTLIRKSVVYEEVNYYNVITDQHMNLFANGILTSCRYNNIYPIVDMKFVKEDRPVISNEVYGVDEKYYHGLRLAEQTLPVEETIKYVNRLVEHEVEKEMMVT